MRVQSLLYFVKDVTEDVTRQIKKKKLSERSCGRIYVCSLLTIIKLECNEFVTVNSRRKFMLHFCRVPSSFSQIYIYIYIYIYLTSLW